MQLRPRCSPNTPATSRQLELPALLDLQVNGFAGVDFNDPEVAPEDVSGAIQRMKETGVAGFLAALITSSLDRFRKCAEFLSAANDPALLGIHMEGPYISREDGARGAHPVQHVCAASIDDFQRRQEAAAGKIRLVTLASEVPGVLGLIEHLVALKVRVASGHTATSGKQIRDAVNAGATLSTHLGNGCSLQMPRHPNLLWEQLSQDALSASLIVDGHHLPLATVKAMIRAKGTGNTILITDAMATAGMGAGLFELNGELVEADETGRVSPPGKPWLAGSALTLDRAVANTVKYTGLPFETVWRMASTQPAEYLGLKPSGKVLVSWDGVNCRISKLNLEKPQAS